MPKYSRAWNEVIYLRRIAEGRGTGEYANYIPWLLVFNITSRGRSTRVLGIKTGRIHHFLSWNELAFFFILEFSDIVLDIREQFPLLSLKETLRIAENANIRHPRDRVSKYPYVLTSDFYILTTQGVKVRTVKESKELSNNRVLEKLEIERRYWLEKGVDWKIVTEKEIDYQKARNIQWLRRGNQLKEFVPDEKLRQLAMDYFLRLYNGTEVPISRIASEVESTFGFHQGIGMSIFQYLAYNRLIPVDMSSKISTVSLRR